MSRADSALRYFMDNRNYTEDRIKDGIARYRKGDGKIRLLDKNGMPIAGAKVHLSLLSHAFRHGANIFMLEELETPEKNQLYREKFAQVFNLATIPFYWSDLEPEQGHPRFEVDSPRIYRRPAPDLCLAYCAERGIEPKCHCLNYDQFLPSWLAGASVETHKAALTKRFAELAERYADVIPSWEVTNETFDPHFDKPQSSAFYHENDFVEWSFATAERYFSKNHLIINDYALFGDFYRGNRSAYYMQIERLLAQGAHVDAIGMQYHSFFPREREADMAKIRYNPVHLYQVLDTYAQLDKKIQITEMTLSAYNDAEEDEQVQAELLRWVYSVFFSHGAMEAIIYWNLVDGYAAWAPQGDMTSGENKYYGGLLRFDMSEKPAFRVLFDLFHREWHTDLTVETDKDGYAHFNGFFGTYALAIDAKGEKKEVVYPFTAAGDTMLLSV